MVSHSKDPFNPLFQNPLEPYPGITIADLNRYLPAIQTLEELDVEEGSLVEGLFLGEGATGLEKLPENTVDLLLTSSPEQPGGGEGSSPQRMTLQDYYAWNDRWLKESYRVIKPTGAIYLGCGWRFSGMYHALLSNYFRVQTRITWRNLRAEKFSPSATWTNMLSDVWFATKTGDFQYNREAIVNEKPLGTMSAHSNFWEDILEFEGASPSPAFGDLPHQVVQRILEASSFRFNWVVDPFMRRGDVGLVAKRLGRRFIGFESDQEQLLITMKRIDQG